jgi:hypothetical protein
MIVSPPFGTRERSGRAVRLGHRDQRDVHGRQRRWRQLPERLGRLRRRRPGGNLFTVGADDRCIAAHDSINAVLKVRHGIVQEIGIADSALNGSRSAQRVFITSFD